MTYSEKEYLIFRGKSIEISPTASFFLTLAFAFVGIPLLILLLAIPVQAVHVLLSPKIEMYIDGHLRFKGSSSGVTIETAGDSTKVEIFDAPLYWKPKAIYVSKNVVIKNIGD